MKLYQRSGEQDVRELGTILGDVLADQTSADAFETVEAIRTSAIAYRDGEEPSRESLVSQVDGLSDERARVVARAFGTYFDLINLAEERERIRSLRDRSQAGESSGGLQAAIDRLGDADPNTAAQVLDDVLIQPTFTAHPTEARRKTVKAKLQSVAADLETLDERLLTDREAETVTRDVRAEVTSLWQTPQLRDRAPEPTDEALNVQWYLENVLFDVLGEFYTELEGEIEEELGDVDLSPLFEFRSWAGSDRDGNPYVTPQVTAETLERQRRVALESYRDALKALSGVLSQGADHVTLDEAFEASLRADVERLPKVAASAADRYPDEPYRQKLKLMRERLRRVGDVRPGGYADAAELVDDLALLADSLRENDAEIVAEAHVDPLRWQAETFGFTLASLDLRDHQQNHTRAVKEALSAEGIDYEAMDEAERVETLTEAILQDEPVIDLTDTTDVSETTARVLTLFDRTADWQAEYGIDAIDTYCISMCEEPSHVLEVLFLADQAGVVSLPDHCGLDVVPLLETKRALDGARRIMSTLFENEAYAQALAARGDRQEVMLGYSDSNKENGYLAAQWSLYRNQKRLARICEEFEVDLKLFHGRGGSISRGGGPMHEALLALPTESVTGPVKFTEQGEAIAEKYGNDRIARRELGQMLDGQVRARLAALEEPDDSVPQAWLDAMATAASAAREEYRDLLETEGFVSYFEQTTPITAIEDLNLGSRPASRSGERQVEDLRAIPWVFSWTQSRCILPGWYSLATGLDAYLADGGDLDTLRTMYDDWPFFRTMLDNAALALAKTELEIADRYASLAPEALREQFFPRIRGEYDRARDLVLSITGRQTLTDREWLEQSLRRRNPYVDPLNLLQVDLLGTEDRTDLEEQTLRLTVKGIAAGMKNTG